jgi:CRISPR-associated protein Cmr3
MTTAENKFRYLITLEPLGLLYGSAGAFLSPENLVGRSGAKFPPSAVTLAGLFAAAFAEQGGNIQSLRVAGPFWSFTNDIQNFCVPTPFHLITQLEPEPDSEYAVKKGIISEVLTWHPKATDNPYDCWKSAQEHKADTKTKPKSSKSTKDTWLPINQWQTPTTVYDKPWKFLPHLHPRLQADQRHVVEAQSGEGSLFLENSVQMVPDTCLTYLSNAEIEPGWYRFGGEGHLVSVTIHPLSEKTQALLNTPLGYTFALITPALWGTNRRSLRYPEAWNKHLQTILTERPNPFRYRLGGKDRENPRRLSRGRYAVPAGTVYVTTKQQPCWYEWQSEIFPKEGYPMNTWGSGLALPLKLGVMPEGAIAS